MMKTMQFCVAGVVMACFVLPVCAGAAGPTVTITSTASDPTNVSPIPVAVTFSREVTGFIDLDVVLSNATLSNFASADAYYFTFNLAPLGEGLVTADIPAGAAQAVDNGENNTAAAGFSRQYVVGGEGEGEGEGESCFGCFNGCNGTKTSR